MIRCSLGAMGDSKHVNCNWFGTRATSNTQVGTASSASLSSLLLFYSFSLFHSPSIHRRASSLWTKKNSSRLKSKEISAVLCCSRANLLSLFQSYANDKNLYGDDLNEIWPNAITLLAIPTWASLGRRRPTHWSRAHAVNMTQISYENYISLLLRKSREKQQQLNFTHTIWD